MLLQSQFICTSAVRSDFVRSALRSNGSVLSNFIAAIQQREIRIPHFASRHLLLFHLIQAQKNIISNVALEHQLSSFYDLSSFFLNLKWFVCYGYYSLKHLLSNYSFWLPLHLSMFYFIVFKSLGSSWNLSHSTLNNVLWLW